MAKKARKFQFHSKDRKLIFETDDAIEANNWRSQGLKEVKKAPEQPNSGAGTKSDKK